MEVFQGFQTTQRIKTIILDIHETVIILDTTFCAQNNQ